MDHDNYQTVNYVAVGADCVFDGRITTTDVLGVNIAAATDYCVRTRQTSDIRGWMTFNIAMDHASEWYVDASGITNIKSTGSFSFRTGAGGGIGFRYGGTLNGYDADAAGAARWWLDSAAAPALGRLVLLADETNSVVLGAGYDASIGFDGTLLQILTLKDDRSIVIGPNGAGIVQLGSAATNYVSVTTTGDLSFVGSAGFYPRRVAQSTEPGAGTGVTQIDTNELLIWRDTDDGKIYLMFNDADSGIKKVEMI